MTLFSYEIFDAVARQGSFNKAAQQLHLTPSAISHAIAVMEAELGFTLFNRGKNGVTMTSYGASLYPSIRAVLNSDEALQQSIARLNGLEKGKVKLGAFNSICSGLLPSILKGFMAHYPQIEVEVYQGTYDDVKEWLRTGQVDIAFLSNNCREEFVLTELFPTLQSLNIGIEVFTMDPVIDSSNVSPRNWLDLAAIIRDNYARYDGFVVLHGTDTMSYTASALSFLLENLAKPNRLNCVSNNSLRK